jgi:probable lipoprotein NlpC
VNYMRIGLYIIICFSVISLTAQSKESVHVECIYLQEYIVQKAYEYLGTPYSYGDESKEGTDCSGLIYAVYKDVIGTAPERSVTGLYKSGDEVKGSPVPGDLVFFNTVGGISHVGIYVGNKKFIHAASKGSKLGVIMSSLEEEYYKTRYLGAKRLLDYGAPVVKVVIPESTASSKLYAPFNAGTPFYLYIVNKNSALEFLTVQAVKGNEVMFSKNIRVERKIPYSLVWFTPVPGEWTFILRSEQGEKLFSLQFIVEG